MSGASRPLQPATQSPAGHASQGSGRSSAGSQRGPSGGGRGAGKRTLIESACQECRRRKTKCDGARPVCKRCNELHVDCQYEAEQGESRWQALRRRNDEIATERTQLRRLLDLIRLAPDHEVQQIIIQLRKCGHDDYVEFLQALESGRSHVLPTTMLASTAADAMSLANHPSIDQQRLPPITSILSDQSLMRPITLDHSYSLSSEDSRDSGSISSIGHVPPPNTLEPSLRQSMPKIGLGPSFNSEESTGSSSHSGMPHGMDGHPTG